MDGRSPQPKTIAIVKQHLYYQQQQQHLQQQSPSAQQQQSRPKKLRHRRIASGSGTHNYLVTGSGAGAGGVSLNASSPVRDRRCQSEPDDERTVRMVDTETQTDQTMHMDMSETDGSPSPFVASRELAMCLRDSGRGRSIEDLNAATAVVDTAPPPVRRASTASRSQPAQYNCAAAPVGSPNGNSDELTYQDACSGSDREPFDAADDRANSNERLEDTRTPDHDEHVVIDDDDDDHLERLGRRVSEFFTENRHSIQSAASSDNGNAPAATDISAAAAAAAAAADAAAQASFVDGVCGTSAATATKVRRGFVSVTGDGSEVTVLRPTDDLCANDSWTDEEGEDPDNQYLGLRRKR